MLLMLDPVVQVISLKLVHNGIEYGIEQILAEAYDLMKRVKNMNGSQMAEVFWSLE